MAQKKKYINFIDNIFFKYIYFFFVQTSFNFKIYESNNICEKIWKIVKYTKKKLINFLNMIKRISILSSYVSNNY